MIKVQDEIEDSINRSVKVYDFYDSVNAVVRNTINDSVHDSLYDFRFLVHNLIKILINNPIRSSVQNKFDRK